MEFVWLARFHPFYGQQVRVMCAARDRLKRGNFGAIEPYHVRTPAGWNNRN